MKEGANALGKKQWLTFATILILVMVANWWTMLYSGDGADIYAFRRSVGPLSWNYIPELLSPYWGWAYRPTFLLYFSAALRLFEADPIVLHAASLLLHLLIILLSGLLVRRLFRNDYLTLLASALFAAGTWNSQAVSWICSTSTLFATFAYLLALHAWLYWRRRGRVSYYIAALLLCIVAFASKEEAYAILGVFVLLDYFTGIDVRSRRQLLPYIPIAIAVVVFIFISDLARHTLTAIQTADIDDVKIVPIALHLNLSAPLRAIHGAFLGVLESFESAINFWGVVLIGVYCWRQDKRAIVLFMWTVITAIPVPLVAGDSATRFRYMPMIAGSVLIAYLLQLHWRNLRTLIQSPLNLAVIAALMVGVFRAFVFSSAGEFAEFDAPTKPFRDYLTSGFPLVPLTLCLCIITSYVLWKMSMISREVLIAIIIVAGGTQLSV